MTQMETHHTGLALNGIVELIMADTVTMEKRKTMSILIKGVEMPTSCYRCVLCNPNGCWCRATKREVDNLYERQPFCPLVAVPAHGRLIDSDALLTSKSVGTQIAGWGKMYHETCIEHAPTIIPADESDMDSFIRIFKEDDEEDGMDSFIRILKE